MKYYTYVHSREDDGRIFYVGKGSGNRAWAFGKRNTHWRRVALKHGVTVQILANWATEQDAFDHEKLLISCLRELGHELCNHTNGGDGASGWRHSPETVAKIRDSNLGQKRSPEVVQRSRIARAEWLDSGIKKYWTPERRRAASEAVAGEKHPNFGKKFSEELRAKLSAAHKGKRNPSSMRPVLCACLGKRFESGTAAANWLKDNGKKNARGSYVIAAARGEFNTAYGYRWTLA